VDPQGLMWTSLSRIRCESFHCYNETPRANHGRAVPLRMVQARANSLKQPRENRKGGNHIVQVDKYNTWASEGRRQAASHHALDKFVDLSTPAYCEHPRERTDDYQQKCNNRFLPKGAWASEI